MSLPTSRGINNSTTTSNSTIVIDDSVEDSNLQSQIYANVLSIGNNFDYTVTKFQTTDAKIATIEQSISNLDNGESSFDATQIESDISTNTQKIASIEQTVLTNTTDISGNTALLQSKTEKIDENASDIAQINQTLANYTTLESDVTELKSDVLALETQNPVKQLTYNENTNSLNVEKINGSVTTIDLLDSYSKDETHEYVTTRLTNLSVEAGATFDSSTIEENIANLQTDVTDNKNNGIHTVGGSGDELQFKSKSGNVEHTMTFGDNLSSSVSSSSTLIDLKSSIKNQIDDNKTNLTTLTNQYNQTKTTVNNFENSIYDLQDNDVVQDANISQLKNGIYSAVLENNEIKFNNKKDDTFFSIEAGDGLEFETTNSGAVDNGFGAKIKIKSNATTSNTTTTGLFARCLVEDLQDDNGDSFLINDQLNNVVSYGMIGLSNPSNSVTKTLNVTFTDNAPDTNYEVEFVNNSTVTFPSLETKSVGGFTVLIARIDGGQYTRTNNIDFVAKVNYHNLTNATVNENQLTLTREDGSTIVYSPQSSGINMNSGYVSLVNALSKTEISDNTNGRISFFQQIAGDSQYIQFTDGLELTNTTTQLFSSSDIIGIRHLSDGSIANGVVTGAVSQLIITSNENNVLTMNQGINDDSILSTRNSDTVNDSFFVIVMFSNSASDTNYTVNLTDKTTQTVTSVYHKEVNQVYINIKKPNGTVFDLNDEINFSIEITRPVSNNHTYDLSLKDGVPFSIENKDIGSNNGSIINIKDKSDNIVLSFSTNNALTDGTELQNSSLNSEGGLIASIEHIDLGSQNGNLIHFLNQSGDVVLSFHANDAESNGSRVQQTGRAESNVTAIEEPVYKTIVQDGDDLVLTKTEDENGIEVNERIFNMFDFYPKGHIDSLIAPKNTISDYCILANELPGIVNGRNASVYRELYPKFRSNEITFIIAFTTIEIINGGSAWNSTLNAPFLSLNNDNTTTATSSQILMLRRAQNHKNNLQIFSHANSDFSSNNTINSYQDIQFNAVTVAGQRYYLTCSIGDGGKHETNIMAVSGNTATIVQNYEHNQNMILNYRQRIPYYLTINSDISNTLGMGVEYERVDAFYSYKSQSELQSLCVQIDGTL